MNVENLTPQTAEKLRSMLHAYDNRQNENLNVSLYFLSFF